MNLFFYPDDSEILENLKSKFKFQVFPSRLDRTTNSSIHFWKKLQLDNFVSRSTDLLDESCPNLKFGIELNLFVYWNVLVVLHRAKLPQQTLLSMTFIIP